MKTKNKVFTLSSIQPRGVLGFWGCRVVDYGLVGSGDDRGVHDLVGGKLVIDRRLL